MSLEVSCVVTWLLVESEVFVNVVVVVVSCHERRMGSVGSDTQE